MKDDWFNINNKQRLADCPPEVNGQDWWNYRNTMNRAEQHHEIGYPIQVDVELNGGCNMRCPFCPHGYEDRPDDRMSVEVYKDTVRQAIALGARSIKMNYINEPMLRRDFEMLVRWTKKQGALNVYVVTNGTCLTKQRRGKLLRSGLTKMFVSLDATTADTYNRQRMSGQFDRVVANILAFIQERDVAGQTHPLVCLNFLVNRINRHEAREFKRQWSNVADVISFQRMNEIPDRYTGLSIDHHEPTAGCKFPFKQLVVDHRGEILPCCKLSAPKLSVGNVRDVTLAEAWKRTQPLRDMHKSNAWQDHPVCGPCMRCES